MIAINIFPEKVKELGYDTEWVGRNASEIYQIPT